MWVEQTRYYDTATSTGARFAKLEQGLTMYDAYTREVVFAIALLLFVKTDNPRHVEITRVKQASAAYPCRKCYWCRHVENSPIRHDNFIEEFYAPRRERRHWENLFASDIISAATYDIPVRNRQGNQVTISNILELGFKENNGKFLLGVSCWDPSKDTPVEVLDGSCLGLIKFMFNKAADCFFNKTQIDTLNSLCSKYGSKAFSNLSTYLKGYKTYLGRDFFFLAFSFSLYP